MTDFQARLKNLTPRHQFLIAIDSDGCAFDTMEIKHKECFIPNIIKYWNLQPIAKYARMAAEFINLYSEWRGINRFPALTMTFDLLTEWPAVQRRNCPIPEVATLRDWIKRETKLGNPALKAEVERTGDPILQQTLAWSEAVNRSIADMVYGVPPFPFVRETLEAVSEWADVLVCSATPQEALQREWMEHGLAQYTIAITGQETGSKKEQLALVKDLYPPGQVIMIGDALGDLNAAHANHLLFFPINPGAEESSWESFYREYAEKFHRGQYNLNEEHRLIDEFKKFLPAIPPWKQ
jgi:phosphoglycolate phosphatase-like HAD superfamily hydrolase